MQEPLHFSNEPSSFHCLFSVGKCQKSEMAAKTVERKIRKKGTELNKSKPMHFVILMGQWAWRHCCFVDDDSHCPRRPLK